MTNYQLQFISAWVVFILGLLGAGILLFKEPADLGLNLVAYHWVAVLNFVMIGLSGVLPSIRRPPVAYDNAGPGTNPDPQPRDR